MNKNPLWKVCRVFDALYHSDGYLVKDTSSGHYSVIRDQGTSFMAEEKDIELVREYLIEVEPGKWVLSAPGLQYVYRMLMLWGESIPITCSHCGKRDTHPRALYTSNDKHKYETYDLCFWCMISADRLKNDRMAKHWWEAMVIKGVHYCTSNPRIVKREYFNDVLGFAGRVFTIRHLETGEIITTNDLWCQGDIAECWRSEFPDNAEILKCD